MSRIYRRPMFRGGGKVSSYGNGITTGLASGGRVGYETGGNILSNIYNKLTSPAVNPETNTPYTAAETQAMLKGTRDEMNAMLGFTPIGRSARGLNVVRSAYSKFPGFRSGLPSASKVKDFFTKSPQSSSTSLGNYKGPAPFGTDRFLGEKLRPMFQNTGAALKDVFGGAGKLKDYKSTIGIGGIGGGYGLKKMYEGFKDRQIGADGTETEELSAEQQQILDLQKQLESATKVNTEQSSAEYKEQPADKKTRLKAKAKEYQEILGEGIKKDSIFDAMVEGGSRLYEGEGAAAALRAANKKLDPITNVKMASRKLALEEDIAVNKALAVAAAKDTETAKKIRALKEGGYSPREIADALAGKKAKDLNDYVKNAGSAGYLQFVNEQINPKSIVRGIDDVLDVKVSDLADGIHYVQDAFAVIQIQNGKVIGQPKYLR